MQNLSPNTSGRSSRSLSGLICGVTLCAAAIGLLTPDADAAAPSIRLVHLDQMVQREMAWARLFPESGPLGSSMLYLDWVLDDATPWAEHVKVVDSSNGAFLALGGLHATSESEPIELVLAEWLPELASDFNLAEMSFLSGVLIGDSGQSLAVFGIRLALSISELSLIVPVEIDVFVPLSFPHSSRHADKLVQTARLALFGPPATMDPEEEGQGDKSAPGQFPPGRTPEPTPSGDLGECQIQAWATLVGTIAALWVESDMFGGPCFAACTNGPQPQPSEELSPAQGCLASCGLGFIAGGEGSITWAWSAWSMASSQCDAPAVGASRSGR